ncbi:MAG: hypothetical protein HN368_04905 [Spirochaetales bacterium]|jgi:hypothetical protein|nr:hypothetical protein [Spirochaetales bacterium]
MPTKNTDLFAVLERISEHYKKNIDNRFVRDTLMRMSLERGDWDHINVIAELPEYVRLQGFEYMDLYDKILALARFVRRAQEEVLPTISSGSLRGGVSQDEILKNMALSTYGSNLNIFADMINELYIKTVECDKNDNQHNPVYTHVAELKTIGSLLIDGNS